VFLFSDQFHILNSPEFPTGAAECVSLGSKVEISQIVETTGGGATNAAATFARLGFKTGIVCRIGRDGRGRDVVDALDDEGISTALVVRDQKRPTAYSTVLTTRTGERTVLVYRGASATFSNGDAPPDRLKAKWLYVTSLAGNLGLVSRLAASGAQVAWNPGAKEIDAGLKKLMPIVRRARVLLLNAEEAGRLTGERDVAGMMAALASPGNVVIVTDGPNGAYVRRDGFGLYAPSNGKKPVSQTGAGDAFGSGFVAGFMKTEDLRASLALGMANAQSVIRQVGAKAGILRAWPGHATLKKTLIATL
jgi:sugar/nucleoside kinase (ribokinase family)